MYTFEYPNWKHGINGGKIYHFSQVQRIKEWAAHRFFLLLFIAWLHSPVWECVFVFIYSFYNSFAHQLIKPYYIQLKTICTSQHSTSHSIVIANAPVCWWHSVWIETHVTQVKCAARLRLAKWNVSLERINFLKKSKQCEVPNCLNDTAAKPNREIEIFHFSVSLSSCVCAALARDVRHTNSMQSTHCTIATEIHSRMPNLRWKVRLKKTMSPSRHSFSCYLFRRQPSFSPDVIHLEAEHLEEKWKSCRRRYVLKSSFNLSIFLLMCMRHERILMLCFFSPRTIDTLNIH